MKPRPLTPFHRLLELGGALHAWCRSNTEALQMWSPTAHDAVMDLRSELQPSEELKADPMYQIMLTLLGELGPEAVVSLLVRAVPDAATGPYADTETLDRLLAALPRAEDPEVEARRRDRNMALCDELADAARTLRGGWPVDLQAGRTAPPARMLPACCAPSPRAGIAERLYCTYNEGGPAERAGLAWNGSPCPTWAELLDKAAQGDAGAAAVVAKWNAVADRLARSTHILMRAVAR